MTYPRESDPPQLDPGVTHVVVNPDGSETRTTDGETVDIAAGEWETFRRQVHKEEELA